MWSYCNPHGQHRDFNMLKNDFLEMGLYLQVKDQNELQRLCIGDAGCLRTYLQVKCIEKGHEDSVTYNAVRIRGYPCSTCIGRIT